MKKIIIPGLLAGLLVIIISTIVSIILNIIFPVLMVIYNDVNIFRSWSDPRMYIYYFVPFITGIILAWTWDKTKNLMKGSTLEKGIYFGLAYWVIATIPGMVITYSCFQLSLYIVLMWTLMNLLNGLIFGTVLSYLNK